MVKEEEAMVKKGDVITIMMVMKETSGTFAGTRDGIHNAKGNARIRNLKDGRAVLKLEDFRVTYGPDLYIYLSMDKGTADYVGLGRLRANAGNQNYEIPSGIDLSRYYDDVSWCKAFSVYFGRAQLTAM
jgi:hypothetical protein